MSNHQSPSGLFALGAALLVGAALAASPAIAQDEGEALETEVETKAEMTEGEEKLAKLLEGRVAGKPQNCIRNLPSQQIRTIDETAYVFGRGSTIWVQRTTRPEDIDRDEIIVSRSVRGGQMCRQDLINTVDRAGGFFRGTITLTEFVPYRRVKDEAES